MSIKAVLAVPFVLLAAAPAGAQWQATTTVNGVRLVDWVGRLLSARPPASVP